MATLIEDIRKWYSAGNANPPDPAYLKARIVETNFMEQRRWGAATEWVYKRDAEYVGVFDVIPAGETASWGDYGPAEVYPLRLEQTVTNVFVKA